MKKKFLAALALFFLVIAIHALAATTTFATEANFTHPMDGSMLAMNTIIVVDVDPPMQGNFTYPLEGSTLTSNTITVTWEAVNAFEGDWWLLSADTPGFDVLELPHTETSVEITGLPTDGSTINWLLMQRRVRGHNYTHGTADSITTTAANLSACANVCDGHNDADGTIIHQCVGVDNVVTTVQCGPDLANCDVVCNDFDPSVMFERRACYEAPIETTFICGMPPHPPILETGLLGTDTDNDGMRDDIEHRLAEIFIDDLPRMHHYAEIAKSIQKIIENSTDMDVYLAEYDNMVQHNQCIEDMGPMELPENPRWKVNNVTPSTFMSVFLRDNEERFNAYHQAQRNFWDEAIYDRMYDHSCQEGDEQ